MNNVLKKEDMALPGWAGMRLPADMSWTASDFISPGPLAIRTVFTTCLTLLVERTLGNNARFVILDGTNASVLPSGATLEDAIRSFMADGASLKKEPAGFLAEIIIRTTIKLKMTHLRAYEAYKNAMCDLSIRERLEKGLDEWESSEMRIISPATKEQMVEYLLNEEKCRMKAARTGKIDNFTLIPDFEKAFRTCMSGTDH